MERISNLSLIRANSEGRVTVGMSVSSVNHQQRALWPVPSPCGIQELRLLLRTGSIQAEPARKGHAVTVSPQELRRLAGNSPPGYWRAGKEGVLKARTAGILWDLDPCCE